MIPTNLITAFFVISFAQIKFSAGDITFQDNGYENIDVAIGANVPEDHSLVGHIMKMFEEGSQVLFQATHGKAYFKKVNIWVPPSWTYRNATVTEKRQPNWYDDAHVLIEEDGHPLYGHNPFTLQPGGCGDPGVYIYLTTQVFKSAAYGNPGRVLVHEWAHFRYGVFNEYVEPFRSDFYYYDENREVRPTLCPANVKGWFLNEKGLCNRKGNGTLSKNCTFVPDTWTKANENITVSLMALPYLESVKYFCNDSQHNVLAPTKHNAKCNRTSTWAVISAHPDFKTQKVHSVSNKSITPDFTFYRSAKPETKYVVLLVDLSVSMDKKIKTVRTSLKNFIKFRMPQTTEVAIMGFSSLFDERNDSNIVFNCTTLVQNFTVVGNKTEDILASLDKLEVKTTDENKRPIGQALNSTLKFLKKERRKESETSVLLITDGPTEYSPVAKTMLEDLKCVSLEVNALALGPKVRSELKATLQETLGTVYNIHMEENGETLKLYDLDSALFEYANKIGSSYNPMLVGRTLSLQSGVPLIKTFSSEDINEKQELLVFVCSAKKSLFNLTIWNEEKELYNKESDCHFTSLQPPGKFNYSLSYISNTRDNSTDLSVIVSVRSLEMHTAPKQTVNLREIFPDLNTSSKVPLVHAILTKGRYAPIIQAEVNLIYCNEAERNGTCETILLEDNGRDPDNFAHDGIYTGFLRKLTSNNSYTSYFTISKGRAIERGNSTRVKKSGAPPIFPFMDRNINIHLTESMDVFTGEIAPEDFDEKEPDPCEEFVCTHMDDYYREITTQSFKAKNVKPDSIPPAPVNDLRAISVGLSNRKAMHLAVALEWTSVGDDYYEGLADVIEIRYASTPWINHDFYKGKIINMSHVIGGSLTPQSPKTRHTIHVEVEAEQFSYPSEMLLTYFVVQTCDEIRQCSTSRPADAKLHLIVPLNNTFLGISTGTLTLMAVFGTVFLVIVGIVILKIIHCLQSTVQKKDGGDDFDSNVYTSKGNTYSNYSTARTKDPSAMEAAEQAVEVDKVIVQSAQKRNKKRNAEDSAVKMGTNFSELHTRL